MFTDTHCHITSEHYDDISKVLDDAKISNITRAIISGSDPINNQEIVALVEKFENCYASLGLHPEVSDKYTESDLNFIEQNLENPKIIAIGEIGLDYHYTKDLKQEQLELFEKQLRIAEENNVPVVIHSRDATLDTINALKKYKLKGIIHSFSGSYETALEYINLGYALGINGVITFKNSNLKEVIEKISLEYIVLETDCPYLTPHPYRGKKNEPKFIIEIARYIAELKGITLEELAKITNENIGRIFDI